MVVLTDKLPLSRLPVMRNLSLTHSILSNERNRFVRSRCVVLFSGAFRTQKKRIKIYMKRLMRRLYTGHADFDGIYRFQRYRLTHPCCLQTKGSKEPIGRTFHHLLIIFSQLIVTSVSSLSTAWRIKGLLNFCPRATYNLLFNSFLVVRLIATLMV